MIKNWGENSVLFTRRTTKNVKICKCKATPGSSVQVETRLCMESIKLPMSLCGRLCRKWRNWSESWEVFVHGWICLLNMSQTCLIRDLAGRSKILKGQNHCRVSRIVCDWPLSCWKTEPGGPSGSAISCKILPTYLREVRVSHGMTIGERLYQLKAHQTVIPFVLAVCHSVRNGILNRWPVRFQTRMRSSALRERRDSSLKVPYLQSDNVQFERNRHNARRHCFWQSINGKHFNRCQDMSSASPSHLRMLSLYISESLQITKWRWIEDSVTVCADMVAILIARSSRALVARGCPELVRRLTMPSLKQRYNHSQRPYHFNQYAERIWPAGLF